MLRTANSALELRAALDASQPGDVVEIARSVTIVGDFTLPPNGGRWIVIRGTG